MSLLDKATIITTPTAHSEGKLHSIKGGSVADFDVVRGSAATRVNAEGLIEDIRVIGDEEITNGDFSNGSTDWTFGTGWSVGEDKASSDGSQTSNSSLFQSNVLTQNKYYKFEFTLSNVTSGSVRLRNGIGDSETYISYQNSNGTYTVYSIVNSSNKTLVVDADSNFIGSIDNISVKEVIDATNIPRIDYTGGTASILLEPQSTNLIPYSEDFSQWNVIGTPTVTSNYGISPDGTQNADRLQMNTNDRIYTSLSVSGNTAFSVYLKGSGIVTLRDSSNTYRQDVILTSEWERYSLYFNDTSNTVQIQNQKVGDVDCEIWGAQVEALPYATSYIPTSGAIATRLADKVTGAGDATTFNSTEGVLYAEMAALADDGAIRYITISDGTVNNILSITFFNNSTITSRITIGGTNTYLVSGVITQTDNFKVALKWGLNNYALWVNGVEVDSNNLLGVFAPDTMSTLDFKRASALFFGKVKSVITFDTALTDAELECLTTI